MLSLKDRLNEHGPIFGRLMVIPNSCWKNKTSHLYCKCRCDCNNVVNVRVDDLLNGRTQSCGCLCCCHATHGLSGRPLYATWAAMQARCYNPKHKDFSNYNKRGIIVCEAWRNNPSTFMIYILCRLGPRPIGHTLDRILNKGNYEPKNVR